jgi:thiol-disulfide isomerase/thioredoxin
MLNRRSFWMTAIFAFALLLKPIVAGEFPQEWSWDDDDQQRQAHDSITGKPMPELSLSNWANGEVTKDDMKGKVLIVDFYATWCGPCMAAIPHNNEMMEKYKDKGVQIIGACTSSRGQEKMDDVVKARGIKYPTAKDPELKSEKAWKVSYYPTYAVVDRKGVLRAIGLQPQYVEKVVEKILSEDEKK